MLDKPQEQVCMTAGSSLTISFEILAFELLAHR